MVCVIHIGAPASPFPACVFNEGYICAVAPCDEFQGDFPFPEGCASCSRTSGTGSYYSYSYQIQCASCLSGFHGSVKTRLTDNYYYGGIIPEPFNVCVPDNVPDNVPSDESPSPPDAPVTISPPSRTDPSENSMAAASPFPTPTASVAVPSPSLLSGAATPKPSTAAGKSLVIGLPY